MQKLCVNSEALSKRDYVLCWSLIKQSFKWAVLLTTACPASIVLYFRDLCELWGSRGILGRWHAYPRTHTGLTHLGVFIYFCGVGWTQGLRTLTFTTELRSQPPNLRQKRRKQNIPSRTWFPGFTLLLKVVLVLFLTLLFHRLAKLKRNLFWLMLLECKVVGLHLVMVLLAEPWGSTGHHIARDKVYVYMCVHMCVFSGVPL